MDVSEIGHGMDSDGSGGCTVASFCEHSNEPSGCIKAGKFLTSWATVSFSRRTLLDGISL